MNKFISISLATALAAFVVACSSDKELPEYAAGLSVVKAQTAFGVLGGTQEVTMATQPAQAYAQDAWLSVATKAETIALTAQTNTSARRGFLQIVHNASQRACNLPRHRKLDNRGGQRWRNQRETGRQCHGEATRGLGNSQGRWAYRLA